MDEDGLLALSSLLCNLEMLFDMCLVQCIFYFMSWCVDEINTNHIFVSLLLCYIVTLIHCYTVTLFHCHFVTLLHCYLVTLFQVW